MTTKNQNEFNTTDAIMAVKSYLLQLQRNIVASLEALDERGEFTEERWTRKGGEGITCVIEHGQVFERGGANFSHVTGHDLPPSASVSRPELAGRDFTAMGVSVVIHPNNPYVPTAHANVRFFIAEKPGEAPIWWFGGGFDLTPFYGFEEDCQFWHQNALEACLPFGKDKYPKFKTWCDDYFYLKHRHEARGIGGLFFDDYNEGGFEQSFQFMQSVGDHFMKGYAPIIERRKQHTFGEREKTFQFYRRGRYVEFNLVYDRGTLFGLQSGGRTESILVSLPPVVHWAYDYQPEEGSAEAELYTKYLPPRDWV